MPINAISGNLKTCCFLEQFVVKPHCDTHAWRVRPASQWLCRALPPKPAAAFALQGDTPRFTVAQLAPLKPDRNQSIWKLLQGSGKMERQLLPRTSTSRQNPLAKLGTMPTTHSVLQLRPSPQQCRGQRPAAPQSHRRPQERPAPRASSSVPGPDPSPSCFSSLGPDPSPSCFSSSSFSYWREPTCIGPSDAPAARPRGQHAAPHRSDINTRKVRRLILHALATHTHTRTRTHTHTHTSTPTRNTTQRNRHNLCTSRAQALVAQDPSAMPPSG